MSKTALNMLAACHRAQFAQWGCKVCAFNPSFCVTNLSGPEMRELRIKLGGRDPREPALALVKIVKGERDDEIEQFAEKSGMLDLDGGILNCAANCQWRGDEGVAPGKREGQTPTYVLYLDVRMTKRSR
jgi:NAD(P)-dependent dehydrogenase (short-subunit alcohol dehydrogenase family)